ncbi:MAG: hypothetical protein WC312_07305 [Candidatus Omnitrophota bacterium]
MNVQSLNQIPGLIFPSLFRHYHLKQKPVIGILGNPGEGKSFSLSIILLLDGLMRGEPVWSNMYVKLTMHVSDRIARMFGLPQGGDAVFEAKAVDKIKLLHMDKEYRDGWHGLDEVNAEYAEATRSTSNVNLYFDRMEQQHRHDLMGMVYTSIHEMWVDYRLRKLTDAFIRVEDVALSPEGLKRRMPTGEVFKWIIYPRSRLICGWTHEQTGMTLGPYYLHTKNFQGIYDTLQKQAEGITKYAVDINERPSVEVEVKRNPATVEYMQKWQWLYDGIQGLHDQGVKIITDDVLWDYLDVGLKGLSPIEIGKQLRVMGVNSRHTGGHTYYFIDDFDLDRQTKHAADNTKTVISRRHDDNFAPLALLR